MAIWQSPKDNSKCAILKARVHAAMRLAIYFFIVLSKHFGAIATHLGFDYNRKDVMRSVSHSDTCFFETK